MVMSVVFLAIIIITNAYGMEKSEDFRLLASGSLSSDSLSYLSSSASCSADSATSSKKLLKRNSKVKLKRDTYQEQKGRELLDAMKKNSTRDIMCLLHPDLDVTDKEGRTPLIIAIQESNDLITQDLLAHTRIDLNKADREGNTPLHYAVQQANDVVIRLLLNDPRVNSLLRNEKNILAHQYINDKSPQRLLDLRASFFVRSRLDLLVDEKMRNLKGNTCSMLDQIVASVKEGVAGDGESQKSYQALPEKIQLPTDDIFIKKMVIYRMAK